MKKASFNSYEFESPSGEDALELAHATRREFSTLQRFLAVLDIPMPPEEQLVRVAEMARKDELRTHLERVDWDLGDIAHASALVLADDWWELEVVLIGANTFTWFRWETTA